MKKKTKAKKVVRGRAAGIVLEDIDSKLDLIAENMGTVHQKLDHLTHEVEGLKEEMVGVRAILHGHDAAVKRHDTEISGLKSRLAH